MKLIVKSALLFIIIFLSVFFSAVMFMNRATINIPITGYEIEIKPGYNAHKVADILLEKKYIRSKILFVSIVKLLRLEKNLKTGWFFIDSHSSTTEIVRSIYAGKFITVSFMIPEGSTFKQINEILVKEQIVSQNEIADFLSDPDYPAKLGLHGFRNIEGFLSPDTYKFNKGADVKIIYSAMIKLFYEKLKEIYPEYKMLNKKDLLYKVTLASIIEKEVRNHSESPRVSGVFYNRIKSKMKLQSCATVQFILDKPKEQLFESDVLIDNPYNTYLYMGLPPGPICSPGYDALRAAFYPENHNYYYFVVKDPAAGTHHFSETYEEHLSAQKKYKAIKGF